MSRLSFIDVGKLVSKAVKFKYDQYSKQTNITEIVNTDKGPVKGVKRLTVWDDAYYSFEKIPFAKPPLGDLRFKAPIPAEPWTTVLDCTAHAKPPLQKGIFYKKYKGSEDCLYLNVFTKEIKPTTLRPVMVWIYGGGFQRGEATREFYSPDYFMSKDIVLVSIAYRLGPLGFLSIDDPAVNVPGNAGIKDQILSLKWVQSNIAAFGGDPNNVTLFGGSAGGASTHFCMLTEQSKGLFHRAILMSGSALCPWAMAPQNHWAIRLAQILHYKGDENCSADIYKFLSQSKGEDLITAASTILNDKERHKRVLFPFTPTVESYETEQATLIGSAYDMLEKTWSNKIPIIISGTSFEGLLFYPDTIKRSATLDEVENCEHLLPADIDLNQTDEKLLEYGLKLKTCYFGENGCNRKDIMKFLELESDREFWHPIYRTVLYRLCANSAPTYLLRFDFDSKEGNYVRNLVCGKDIRGVCHADDVSYIFRGAISGTHITNSPEDLVIRTMINIFTSFAITGNPNCQELAHVNFEPVKNSSEIMCLNISHKTEFIKLPELDKMKVWDSFYRK
ncbi:esterase B1-like isoform X1 [Teleopsis dalmanni]|uniref:esterase B1-like isoform X1 n=1 Tax=Teleopsis dalmanni TaxID=139649 RepID=UPI0018CCA2C4|nr:esterase B1-like isoform X1 [Teleopsis dalmanni]